jgi:hypothetical protein
VTNKQAMVNLSDEAFFDKWHWLTHVYGKRHTDSRIAIIEWLGKEAKADPDRVRVVRCSDCRFWEPPTDFEADDGCTAGHCRNDYGACANQQTDMNWFCADVEREG